MRSDTKLKIKELSGFRNENINNFKTPGRPGLPGPTSLMIDADGTVVCKDQSDNYTLRSDPTVVGGALATHFAT